ncbi:MAG: aminopeptidase P family protein [Lachnospiraceae bacterium]|nr:aminopeptidase P family protein [Lachnospiraceae bacterium]MDY3302525.1 aminopeptidase P family protein [Lachnospiraceae bacterium]
MTVKERLGRLREEMEKRNIGAYLVPMADFHHSEYVGAYFEEVKYISGFTGTNATVVVTMDEAGLWTDGRYFIQAERQLKDSTILLYRMAEEGVPTVAEFLRDKLPQGKAIGFDGRCIMADEAASYQKIAEEKKGSLYQSEDLIDLFWEDRPALPHEKTWVLKTEHAGRSVTDKLEDLRKIMEEKGAEAHLLSSLCDIAWLLNMRGNDIASVPVFLSFVYVTARECRLYIQDQAMTDQAGLHLRDANVDIRPYEAIYEDLPLMEEKSLLLDKKETNARLFDLIPDGVVVINDFNPTELSKAVKNETEIKDTIHAHIEDGIAVTHFIYWVKNAIKTEKLTELDADHKIREFREQADDFLDVSFETIAAYGPNAAMMHYSATPEEFSEMKPEGFLLVDSGGHYMTGTTDITRTIVLGPLTAEMKHDFTTVLRSHLRLMTAHFPQGCIGQNLDILARGPVWDEGLDYRCGTGHGVGHILNVHEGPQSFRWKVLDKSKVWELQEGMIITDEPGLYIENGYGIRTENELLVEFDRKTEYGKFLKLRPITYVPIDRDAINVEELTHLELKALNEYHEMVYQTLKDSFEGAELDWLREVTLPL